MDNSSGTQQPVYTPDPARSAADNVDSGFVKGIVSACLAWIPIGSIVAIVLGSQAIAHIDAARALAARYGIALSGKQIAGRITGMVGWIAGIVMTVFWAVYFLIIIAVLVFVVSIR